MTQIHSEKIESVQLPEFTFHSYVKKQISFAAQFLQLCLLYPFLLVASIIIYLSSVCEIFGAWHVFIGVGYCALQ